MTATQTKTSMLLESASRAAERAQAPRAGMRTLGQHRLLCTLQPAELARFMDDGQWLTFSPGQTVSEQGTAVEQVMFVAQGRAKAEVTAPARPVYRAVVAFVGQGDDIGLLSMLDGAPHSASVIAMEELRALSVPMAVVHDHLEAHPEWHRPLAEMALARLRSSNLWLQSLL